jgi:hypothetical protein
MIMGLFSNNKSVGQPRSVVPEAQTCPNCGARWADQTKPCPSCGAKCRVLRTRPARISLQATPKLIKDIDELVEPLGFKDRSELIRQLLREGVDRYKQMKTP